MWGCLTTLSKLIPLSITLTSLNPTLLRSLSLRLATTLTAPNSPLTTCRATRTDPDVPRPTSSPSRQGPRSLGSRAWVGERCDLEGKAFWVRGEGERAWARVGLGWRYQEEGEGEVGAEEGTVEVRDEDVRDDEIEGGVEGTRRPCSGEGRGVAGRRLTRCGDMGAILTVESSECG